MRIALLALLAACSPAPSDSGVDSDPDGFDPVDTVDANAARIGYETATDCSSATCRTWHTFTADLTSSDVEVRATRPSEAGRTTSSWAALVGATVAVNGDFFSGNTPRGVAIGNGESWGTADRSDHGFIACDANDVCTIDAMNNLAAIDPAWQDAVGGNGQGLVHDGRNLRDAAQDANCGDFCTGDHPRTAVGLTQDRSRLIFVAAEGRRSGTRGPTFLETATFLVEKGAWWGLMLDGGGSTTLVIDGVRTSALPADQGERVVANHLGLVYPFDGVVGVAVSGDGFWAANADGRVRAYGGAAHVGDASDLTLNAPIRGIAATPSGGGLWLAASDGGVFAFGDAAFHGSMGGTALNSPIVGIAATPGGGGYWLVAGDGGIFAFGDAGFFGSAGDIVLNQPVVGMAATPSGQGYWLVASDGGVFTYGDAAFFGSAGDVPLNAPITGIAASPAGYWLVASDGGVFAYGDAGFYGSAVGRLFGGAIALLPGEGGYRIASSRGETLGFGALE